MTASGLQPENFKAVVDGKNTGLYTLKIKTTWKYVSPTLVDVSFL